MSRRPTHSLVITDKENTKSKTLAGSAWMNDDETFATITLKPGVVLSAADSTRYWFNLVKNDESNAPRGQRATRPQGVDPTDVPDDEFF